MRKSFLICCIYLAAFASLSAFEGKLDYRVRTGDMDWSMECFVSEDFFKAQIYYEGTLYQSLIRNADGVMIVNERSKQVAIAYKSKKEWGRDRVQNKIKTPKLPDATPFETSSGLKGSKYKIRSSGKTFFVEILSQYGAMPGVMFDQFSTLKPLGDYGYPLLEEVHGIPHRIYYKKKSKTPILELVKVEPTSIDDSVFEIPSDYNLSKLTLKSR